MNIPRQCLLLAAFLCLPLSARSQSPAIAAGHWEGAVQAGGNAVRLEFDLAKNDKGALVGTFNSPANNVAGLPLSDVAANGKSVRFVIKGADGGVFAGLISDDGKGMSGEFTTADGVHTLPFTLTRTGEPTLARAAKNAPIAKELEGKWTGALDVEGKHVRLVLTMANHPDGGSTATILNVDEGVEIPVTSIAQNASSLTLQVKSIGGVYAATSNGQNGELVGTWKQGSLSLPLAFRRVEGGNR
ncbi:MAG: hypothetical protein ABJF01_15710 [bacterium]